MVGNIVKQIRVAMGDTQKEMAEKLSFSHVTLSHIENGTRILDANSFKKIIEIYDLDDYMKEKLQDAYNQQFEVKKIVYPEIERLMKENKALKERNNELEEAIRKNIVSYESLKSENEKKRILIDTIQAGFKNLEQENIKLTAKIREIKDFVNNY